MHDLFSHEAQTNDRDRSLTTAIIDRALAEGYSVRIQDAHGENTTLTTRSRETLLKAVGQSRETTFHIINMKVTLGKNVGQVTVYHGDDADRITEAQARTDTHLAVMDRITAPTADAEATPILDEIADYSDQITAEHERRTAAKTAARVETENVPTSALREGDLILRNGCTMQLGPINESQSHKPNEHGAVYWSRAIVLKQHDETIPKGWFDRDDQGNRTWLIQGNDLATWSRYK